MSTESGSTQTSAQLIDSLTTDLVLDSLTSYLGQFEAYPSSFFDMKTASLFRTTSTGEQLIMFHHDKDTVFNRCYSDLILEAIQAGLSREPHDTQRQIIERNLPIIFLSKQVDEYNIKVINDDLSDLSVGFPVSYSTFQEGRLSRGSISHPFKGIISSHAFEPILEKGSLFGYFTETDILKMNMLLTRNETQLQAALNERLLSPCYPSNTSKDIYFKVGLNPIDAIHDDSYTELTSSHSDSIASNAVPQSLVISDPTPQDQDSDSTIKISAVRKGGSFLESELTDATERRVVGPVVEIFSKSFDYVEKNLQHDASLADSYFKKVELKIAKEKRVPDILKRYYKDLDEDKLTVYQHWLKTNNFRGSEIDMLIYMVLTDHQDNKTWVPILPIEMKATLFDLSKLDSNTYTQYSNLSEIRSISFSKDYIIGVLLQAMKYCLAIDMKEIILSSLLESYIVIFKDIDSHKKSIEKYFDDSVLEFQKKPATGTSAESAGSAPVRENWELVVKNGAQLKVLATIVTLDSLQSNDDHRFSFQPHHGINFPSGLFMVLVKRIEEYFGRIDTSSGPSNGSGLWGSLYYSIVMKKPGNNNGSKEGGSGGGGGSTEEKPNTGGDGDQDMKDHSEYDAADLKVCLKEYGKLIEDVGGYLDEIKLTSQAKYAVSNMLFDFKRYKLYNSEEDIQVGALTGLPQLEITMIRLRRLSDIPSVSIKILQEGNDTRSEVLSFDIEDSTGLHAVLKCFGCYDREKMKMLETHLENYGHLRLILKSFSMNRVQENIDTLDGSIEEFRSLLEFPILETFKEEFCCEVAAYQQLKDAKSSDIDTYSDVRTPVEISHGPYIVLDGNDYPYLCGNAVIVTGIQEDLDYRSKLRSSSAERKRLKDVALQLFKTLASLGLKHTDIKRRNFIIAKSYEESQSQLKDSAGPVPKLYMIDLAALKPIGVGATDHIKNKVIEGSMKRFNECFGLNVPALGEKENNIATY